MFSQTHISSPAFGASVTNANGPTGQSKGNWLYAEGPEEIASEDDDFEGNRNWAVILTLSSLAMFPVAALTLVLI